MAYKLNIRKFLLMIVYIIIISCLVFSCEEQVFNFNINCNECYPVKPDSADLIVRITINEENPWVPLVFYRGKAEEEIIEWIDTSYTDTLYLYSPVDEFYSVKASYKKNGKTIIAIDGDKLKTSLVTDVCERDCWIIKRGILDVRLN
jgi:hypothetical protein